MPKKWVCYSEWPYELFIFKKVLEKYNKGVQALNQKEYCVEIDKLVDIRDGLGPWKNSS